MYPLNLEHLKTLKYLPLEREKDREMEIERKEIIYSFNCKQICNN